MSSIFYSYLGCFKPLDNLDLFFYALHCSDI